MPVLLEDRADQRPVPEADASRARVTVPAVAAGIERSASAEGAAATGIGRLACLMSGDFSGLGLLLLR